MGQRFTEMSALHQQFIRTQKIYFVGTATADGRVNVSPKGMDSFRIIDANRIAWLNVTGSGNETSAHVQENPRMTIMFAAFEGNPMIMRLYGTAQVIHKNDTDWPEFYSLFDPNLGARQIFELKIDLVQTSCGMGVPLFDYVDQRDNLNQWAIKQGEQGVVDYWQRKNQLSLDGKPTHIMAKNGDNPGK